MQVEKRISFRHRVINLIAPEACMVCGCRLGIDETVLCTPCNLHLPRTLFASDPYNNVMARRFWGRIPIERAAALFFYEAGSEVSHIIHNLEYHNHPEVGTTMGRMAAEEMVPQGFFEEIDMIVPVPLERKHQRQRGYNQSEYLALGIADELNIPYIEALKALRPHSTQTHKGALERWQNIQGNYALNNKNTDLLPGKHILLVDDVVTTGSTLTVCASLLKQIPGVTVSLFTLAAARLE